MVVGGRRSGREVGVGDGGGCDFWLGQGDGVCQVKRVGSRKRSEGYLERTE